MHLTLRCRCYAHLLFSHAEAVDFPALAFKLLISSEVMCFLMRLSEAACCTPEHGIKGKNPMAIELHPGYTKYIEVQMRFAVKSGLLL